jgi:LppX_LprAFG lipoprotein
MEMTAKVTEGYRAVWMSGSGDFTNNPNQGSLTMRLQGAQVDATMRVVLRGTTMYMTSNLFAGRLPNGASWLSIDLGKEGKALGVDISALSSQAPASALEQLKASGRVTEVGQQTLAGVPTTHYTATIDSGQLDKLDKELHYDVSYAPVDVWIDGRGLVRRMHFVTVAAAHDAVPETVTDMTLDLSRYGEPVSVAVPGAAETFDTTELADRYLKEG